MVLWVSLFADEGAVIETVRVVLPVPVPELTVGVTVTVQAGLEEAAETEIVVLGATPDQLNAHDWVMVDPGATYVASEGGVITPPQGAGGGTAAKVGSAKIIAKVPNRATMANVDFGDTKATFW